MCRKTRNRRVKRIFKIDLLINKNIFLFIYRSAILGFDVDANEITIGMTLPIWADLDITLDGDG